MLLFVTGGALRYQNDIIPVLSPLIAWTYSFLFRGVVHPETARGKSLFDAHFSNATRNVHRFVKETGQDVAKSEELVRGIHYEDVIANCAVHFFLRSQRWYDSTEMASGRGGKVHNTTAPRRRVLVWRLC